MMLDLVFEESGRVRGVGIRDAEDQNASCAHGT